MWVTGFAAAYEALPMPLCLGARSILDPAEWKGCGKGGGLWSMIFDTVSMSNLSLPSHG